MQDAVMLVAVYVLLIILGIDLFILGLWILLWLVGAILRGIAGVLEILFRGRK